MNTNIRRPIQVCVFLVTRKDDLWEYLLLHRVPKFGAFWQGVTGAPEEGETLAQAARREVLEETGFIPVELDLIDLGKVPKRPPVREWWHGTEDWVPSMSTRQELEHSAR